MINTEIAKDRDALCRILEKVQDLRSFWGTIRPVLTSARSCRNCGGKVITSRKTETAIEDGRTYQSPETEFHRRRANVLEKDPPFPCSSRLWAEKERDAKTSQSMRPSNGGLGLASSPCKNAVKAGELNAAYLNHIFRWLKDGRSARELLGVVCALMASAATERAMQDRLSHVRAFINCHIDLLQDPSPLAPLTVTDVVEQLVLQESDSVFDANTDPQWTASIERGVVWVNKPAVQHACRWTMRAGGAVHSLAYSADGSRLALAEGKDVVVCDAASGFEVHRFKGHM